MAGHNDVGYSDRVMVNFGTMDVTIGDLDKIINRFDQITADLLTNLRTILGTGDGNDQAGDMNAWNGAASSFFEERRKVWHQQAEDMRLELQAAKTHVGQASENYQIAERHNANMWTSY